MSGHVSCICEGTRKERMKNWYVVNRNINHSYFEKPKGAAHYSEYSTIRCSNCIMRIRSKAKYVYSLPDKGEKQ